MSKAKKTTTIEHSLTDNEIASMLAPLVGGDDVWGRDHKAKFEPTWRDSEYPEAPRILTGYKLTITIVDES